MTPLLALIIFYLGLAIEVLHFSTMLVVVVVHPAVVSATGKLYRELLWCFEVLVSNKCMLEDVKLHMLLPVLYFRVRMLMRDVRRTIWGVFFLPSPWRSGSLYFSIWPGFLSSCFSRLSICHPYLSPLLRGCIILICSLVVGGANSHSSRLG